MIGIRIKKMRKLRKLTQEQLAEKLETTRETITRYETSVFYPDAEKLVGLADALECTTDYLLGRTDNPDYENRTDLPEPLKAVGVTEIEMKANEEISDEELEILIEYAKKLKRVKGNGKH